MGADSFSWILVDRWGRRPILMSGAVIVRTGPFLLRAIRLHDPPVHYQYSRGTLRWPSRWVRQAIGCTSMFQRRLKLLSCVLSYSMLHSDIAGDPFHGYIHRKYVYQ